MSTAELFSRAQAEAVNEDGDPEAYWEVVNALHDAAPHEVWSLVAPLATHDDVRLQQLVPDVLRGLGREAQPLAAQTLELFAKMVAAGPPAELLACIANACVDFHDAAVVTMLAPHAGHSDDGVREGVLHALRRSSHPDALAALINLSRDGVEELREWATFALGSQLPLVDGPEVREALAARLTDAHEPTRDEAMIGLGLRGDARAIGPLRSQLERGFVGVALFEAARALASPKLAEALRALEKNPKLTDDERAELTAAIAACG
ncbi:MAG: HEAT repeat domain-containing protein [Archangium sp.]|nr:HEAT repeat domain-containing protein [Archangium sp.]